MPSNEKQVTLTLTADEALVLFEFVSRFSDMEKLEVEHQAEEVVLWIICGLLEKQLVAPFKKDYGEILERAREAVRGQG